MHRARCYRKFVICIVLFATVWIVMLVVGPKLTKPPRVLPFLDVSYWSKSSDGDHSSSLNADARDVRNQSKPVLPGRFPEATRHLPTPVLLFASMRTGSSFVGEALGNSKDVFYLFEPGHALQTTQLAKLESMRSLGLTYNVASLCINMLAKLYRCDFRDLDFYLKYLSDQKLDVLKHRTPRLYEACRYRQPHDATQCKVTLRMATKSCKQSKYVIVKEIRIPQIEMLTPLIEAHGLDLKVINLIRDPRPMTASVLRAMRGRNLFSSNKTLPKYCRGVLSKYCRYGKANLELGKGPSWQRRYMFLRYEDMASDPTSTTNNIFKFLGRRKVPKTVQRWIEKNTKSGTPGPYSTSGNSSQVYQAWRGAMPFEVAKAIEEVGQCREMMDMMGYRLLEDERHQRNLSRSLYGHLNV
ncbi:carbohydrate sulfotransferase 3-like [Patiria miniata]|uniref:Sulfotransferase domain-containing protein n=1 Tax=Patiria miniata TaxID=46514 RepID=A0A914BQP0_PATMI|nr:carbohydrate sulfotransferase 3-like [Patiria miniata]